MSGPVQGIDTNILVRFLTADDAGLTQRIEAIATRVYGADGVVNRNYEGEISAHGDTVHITGVTQPTIVDYTKYTNLTIEGEPLGVDSRRAKDYNSGIHILEALAELYQVWPDPLLRDRLERTFRIVRDEFTTDRGYMKLYFSRDWVPLSNEDSTRAVQEANLGSDLPAISGDGTVVAFQSDATNFPLP